ncbi:MAG TPA: thioesterase [Acholeplasmatales bacterium]|nr:thioesterase [Acholeplasmatales bacterium]
METDDSKNMTLTDFPLHSYDKVRYADTDRQGHVNNAVFSQCFETGRVELLYDPARPLYDVGCTFVIASSKVDYRKEIVWPGTVVIGTAVTRIGTSSITFSQGLFQNDAMVASGETVIVHVDPQTSRSRPLSAETKLTLANHLRP